MTQNRVVQCITAPVAAGGLDYTNLRTCQLLRYCVPVQVAARAPHETVHLIDYGHPESRCTSNRARPC